MNTRPGTRIVVAVGLASALLGACGSPAPAATRAPSAALAAPATAAPPAPTTSRPSAAPTGPASFKLTIAGDANVKGSWGASYGINCDNPAFDANDLLFFTQSPDGKAVVLITLNPGSLDVSERAGAGATYTDREFHGTGVSAFDAARGATFDSDVSIVPSMGSKPGILGTITHVSGSIDSGGQTPGSSTLVASGTSPEGPV